MRVQSQDEKELFQQLTELAGDALLLQDVLKSLLLRLGRPPKLEEVVHEVVRVRAERDSVGKAVAAG